MQSINIHPILMVSNQIPVGIPQGGPEHKSILPTCHFQQLAVHSCNVITFIDLPCVGGTTHITNLGERKSQQPEEATALNRERKLYVHSLISVLIRGRTLFH